MRRINYDNLKNKNIKIIDVQEKYEFKTSHIEGSINIPYDELMNNYKNYLNKNDLYYITCKKGHLSKRAVSILEYLGYNVVMLEKTSSK